MGVGPGPIFVGDFSGSLGFVTVNSGSHSLTLVSGFLDASPVSQTIDSGGVDPVAAITGDFNDGGFDDLVVANNEDGILALLLGGPDGLTLQSTLSDPEAAPTRPRWPSSRRSSAARSSSTRRPRGSRPPRS